MSDQWFYLQQWKKKRWSYINKELSFQEAKSLWAILINGLSGEKPLAYIKKGDTYKVVLKPEDGWEVVECNASFLNNTKLVQRVGNEKI